MMLFMAIVCLALFVALIVVAAIQPRRTALSGYELKRRKAAGDSAAEEVLSRELLVDDVISLQRVMSALLLVLFVITAVAAFGWLVGILLAVVVAQEYGALSRRPAVSKRAQALYDRHEDKILGLIRRYPAIVRILRNVSRQEPVDTTLDSREELAHLIETSGQLLSPDEKKLLTHGLSFGEREVREIMTPRGVIDSIDQKELLGPLVLDDLHKTGHSRFPVIDGDVDHVVGMLHIQNLFTLDSKRSTTAAKAMEPRVFYIKEDQNLQHALAAFIRTHHHLFVVVNEFRETVGLLSLEDVIEALLGRKIVDEFDAHDDLRAVAMRNPRGNNHPKKHEDV